MTRFPFPQNQRRAHCCYPTQADHRDVESAFDRWREEIVTREGALGGYRLRRPDTPDGVANSTVSEGIAYGMIIAVMMGDRELFDGLWGYAQHWLNDNGLMHWYIAPDGLGVLGRGAAADADEDMAWALAMADRQWGGSGYSPDAYADAAKRLIAAIWRCEIDHAIVPYLLIPGDGWRGRDVFNPSYFAPNQYRLFGELTGDVEGWGRVVGRGYQMIERCLNSANHNLENGLVPAWCNTRGEPVEAFPGAMCNYQTDSARTPFRLGQDWVEYATPSAREYLAKISRFFAAIGADAIVDGYALTGVPEPDPHSQIPNLGSAVFVGSAAVAAMHDVRYQDFVDACYARVRTGQLLARSRYYNQCWTVLSLLMLSGNLVTFPAR